MPLTPEYLQSKIAECIANGASPAQARELVTRAHEGVNAALQACAEACAEASTEEIAALASLLALKWMESAAASEGAALAAHLQANPN
jgi:hypothetical protein